MCEENLLIMRTGSDHFYEYCRFRGAEPSELNWRGLECCEIYLLVSGSVDCIIEGHSYRMQHGDCILTSDDDVRCFEHQKSESPEEMIVIRLYHGFMTHIRVIDDTIPRFFGEACSGTRRQIRTSKVQQGYLASRCSLIEEAYSEQKDGYLALMYAAVMSITAVISRAWQEMPQITGTTADENTRINQVIDYINGNLRERHSIDSLAGRFYISGSYLSHQFRKYTGYSVYQYITKKRLLRARTLLSKGMPVTEVYIECGFSDYSNFLKMFKREYGYLPSRLHP